MSTETVDILRSTCFACGHHLAVPFYKGGQQPLATIAWPASVSEAQGMKRLPIDFVRCVCCGHIYNRSFRYEDVPYSAKPNLMFNQGSAWSVFISDLQQKMVDMLPENATVVEIGHGDGSFLAALSRLKPKARLIGFDPHGAREGSNNVELRAELFLPSQHMLSLKPDLIITRHVLEHLTNPLGFLQEIGFVAGLHGIKSLAYFEVPCVDRVLETGRTVDLYYEHSSQFTTGSFTAMLEKAGVNIEKIGHGYDGEVIFAFVRMDCAENSYRLAHEAEQYCDGAAQAQITINEQLKQIHLSGKKTAIWGGTGKSAAFMNYYGADAQRFPIVIDSDKAKVGTFVPGTGQEIRFRDYLTSNPVDIVIIPPQWRAGDILGEMQRHGIKPSAILIEHEGRLIDYVLDAHPYNREKPAA